MKARWTMAATLFAVVVATLALAGTAAAQPSESSASSATGYLLREAGRFCFGGKGKEGTPSKKRRLKLSEKQPRKGE